MPNHITTRVQTQSKIIDKLIDTTKSDLVVDFNKIIPMPEGVEWYAWSLENWGTKWNAYEATRIKDTELVFQTAWSVAAPVFLELSKSLDQGIGMRVSFADEDTGSNVGHLYFVGGREATFNDLSGTKEGYELAFELTGGKEYYKLNPNTDMYEYDED